MKKLTTGQAIREFCKQCVGSGSVQAREGCGGEYVYSEEKECALFKNRIKGKGNLRIIRKNCIECVGGVQWVQNCSTETCPLYEFRSGKHSSGKKKDRILPKHPEKRGLAGQFTT